ncbi:ribonuclease H-like domain-containing protein [Suillus plorans]|uniref:ribonuclease H n=1 Tax=Suillus plorans TaxID=116603 RepID=A0A9P7AS15_9AGAM|nr:ribonuclease H-like domain-containing protein [Suillus plorans]KAG1793915.1 ribonuclease H-like domain-containing protein [Suillus plorans]
MTTESHLNPPSSRLSSSAVLPPAISPPRSVASTSSTFRPSAAAAALANVKEDEPGYDVVYSDGACKGNGQVGSVAGVGVWWGWNDPRNIAERCPGDQTNNRAELIAIVRTLETAPFSQRPLMIKTDSMYSIQCFESWLPKWSANGFRTANGQSVKNAELIRYLAALLYAREQAGPKIVFKHVRGHVGIEGNECADRLANDGTLQPELPERDWEQLTRDLKKKPRTSRTVPEPVKSDTSTSRQATVISSGSSSRLPQPSNDAFPPGEHTPKPGLLSQAELDAYASCLLETDDLESDLG